MCFYVQSWTDKVNKFDISAPRQYFGNIFSESWSAHRNMLKNTPLKFFPWVDVFGLIFGLNIWSQFRSWVTKCTSKWLMMKLNCWKWFAQQQQCPWPPVSKNFSGKLFPWDSRVSGRHWVGPDYQSISILGHSFWIYSAKTAWCVRGPENWHLAVTPKGR